ncbi:flavin reductase family protein [Litoribacter populi]|uniref:flavin reductase family protein n=1 Tax=Litoribacter populi TaxID=2598460 RepID=UPI00117F2116|nr:flavin reductase family protein [Litoribacter populi]
MKIIDPKNVSTGEFHSYMLGAIAPRPIAFASTVDKEGNVNLSPFSFFNAFGSNPPVVVFSPARRVRDNSTKHTLENVHEVSEVVINIVNYKMVEQMSLASTEYDKGVNEFLKAGFTEVKSELVKPPRVAEAPVAFECKVLQVLPVGEGGGAANLVICEILLAHIDENILDTQGKIDPFKLDPVARMGGDWYCRASGESLFEIPKPLRTKGIGVDNIPAGIRDSVVLTGNNLGRLGNVEKLPTGEEVEEFAHKPELQEIRTRFQNDQESYLFHLHQLAQEYILQGDVDGAWKVLLQH